MIFYRRAAPVFSIMASNLPFSLSGRRKAFREINFIFPPYFSDSFLNSATVSGSKAKVIFLKVAHLFVSLTSRRVYVVPPTLKLWKPEELSLTGIPCFCTEAAQSEGAQSEESYSQTMRKVEHEVERQVWCGCCIWLWWLKKSPSWKLKLLICQFFYIPTLTCGNEIWVFPLLGG